MKRKGKEYHFSLDCSSIPIASLLVCSLMVIIPIQSLVAENETLYSWVDCHHRFQEETLPLEARLLEVRILILSQDSLRKEKLVLIGEVFTLTRRGADMARREMQNANVGFDYQVKITETKCIARSQAVRNLEEQLKHDMSKHSQKNGLIYFLKSQSAAL